MHVRRASPILSVKRMKVKIKGFMEHSGQKKVTTHTHTQKQPHSILRGLAQCFAQSYPQEPESKTSLFRRKAADGAAAFQATESANRKSRSARK